MQQERMRDNPFMRVFMKGFAVGGTLTLATMALAVGAVLAFG